MLFPLSAAPSSPRLASPRQEPYLHNFVQATFDALAATGTDVTKGTLLIGGDGRYFNDKAIQIIIKIAAANGCAYSILVVWYTEPVRVLYFFIYLFLIFSFTFSVDFCFPSSSKVEHG